MKILLAPVNIAGQPFLIVEELRRLGHDAYLLQYRNRRAEGFRYATDRTVDLAGRRIETQLDSLKWSLRKGFDIYHFWLRSLFYGNRYEDLLGLDIPLIKARGGKIVYRFTGYDLRLRSLDLEKNPFSAYRYGLQTGFDEQMQQRYLGFLQEYVDQFIVQDPEMQSFFPQAKVVPRVIDLVRWPYAGITKNDRPLVVHAPTNPAAKGTRFIEGAVQRLQAAGLRFDYRAVRGLPHQQAAAIYRRADIVVDQLHAGWYGVLAIEAMALGKPVVTYIREDLSTALGRPIPVQQATPENIAERLKALIVDHDLREHLSRAGRAFVEEHHDLRRVVPQLVEIYRRTLSAPPKSPDGCRDIEFFKAQLAAVYADPAFKWHRRLRALMASGNKRGALADRLRRLLDLRKAG